MSTQTTVRFTVESNTSVKVEVNYDTRQTTISPVDTSKLDSIPEIPQELVTRSIKRSKRAARLSRNANMDRVLLRIAGAHVVFENADSLTLSEHEWAAIVNGGIPGDVVPARQLSQAFGRCAQRRNPLVSRARGEGGTRLWTVKNPRL